MGTGILKARRSTLSAIHMVNGIVVLTTARGQKSASLSSAEAELNALVAAAADGMYLKRCLEFLVEEAVIHDCLVDNSAAVQLSHKRGPGKLRHIDGKLLWVQDCVAQQEFNVKAVGTVFNIADLGTKPLTKARIDLILYWRRSYSVRGERLGQEEHDRVQEGTSRRIRIQRIAKFLHRIILLGGLAQVAGERVDTNIESNPGSEKSWLILLTLFLEAIVVILCGIVYKLWKRLVLIEIKDAQRVD